MNNGVTRPPTYVRLSEYATNRELGVGHSWTELSALHRWTDPDSGFLLFTYCEWGF